MIPFKEYYTIEEGPNNFDKIILKLISGLKEKNISLSGGNCGQFSYGLAKYCEDVYKKKVEIGVLSNLIPSEVNQDIDMLLDDVDIYHVFIDYKEKMFDETGLITEEYLVEFSKTHYDNPNPGIWVPLELNERTRQIISFNTDYSYEWTYIYKQLETISKHQ